LGVAVTPLVLVAGLFVSAELRGRRLAERLIGATVASRARSRSASAARWTVRPT
jgi:hypothetical protein